MACQTCLPQKTLHCFRLSSRTIRSGSPSWNYLQNSRLRILPPTKQKPAQKSYQNHNTIHKRKHHTNLIWRIFHFEREVYWFICICLHLNWRTIYFFHQETVSLFLMDPRKAKHFQENRFHVYPGISWRTPLQWSFQVPVKGGRDYITTQRAIYKWYICGIYCQLGDYMPPTTLYRNLKNPLTIGFSSPSHHSKSEHAPNNILIDIYSYIHLHPQYSRVSSFSLLFLYTSSNNHGH